MAADVHNLSLVLLLNFCAKFGLMFPDCRHKRQAVNRWWQFWNNGTPNKLTNKMVKENKIKELINDKVVLLVNQEINKYGFKYLKSKGHFIRQDNGFNQIVSIYTPYSPLAYDENTEQFFLTFNISSGIEIPEYEKWHLEKLGEKTHFSYGIDKLTSQIELSLNDFDSESFYEANASQQFKRSVTLSIMGGSDQQQDIISINDLLKTNIPNLVSKLKENSNILQIHKNREYPYQYTYLLLFGGYQEMAYEELHKYYEHLLNEIETKIKVSETEASSHIGALNRLIKESQKITTLSFNNPYKRSVKISDTQNDYFEFSRKTKFSEILRLDTSQFDIKSVDINSKGDILLFARSQKIIKLNSYGKLLLEQDIETKKGFDTDFWGVPSGVVNGTNHFYVNNYIVKDENTILELPLPIQKLKKGKLQNPHISDFAFCEKANKYLIIYEDNFIIYNIDGQVEKTLILEQKFGNKIIMNQKILISISLVVQLYIIEWNVTENHIKRIILKVCGFISLYINVGFLIKLLCNSSCDTVNLNTVKGCVGNCFGKNGEEVSRSHRRVKNLSVPATFKTELLKGIIDALYQFWLGIVSCDSGMSGILIFFFIK